MLLTTQLAKLNFNPESSSPRVKTIVPDRVPTQGTHPKNVCWVKDASIRALLFAVATISFCPQWLGESKQNRYCFSFHLKETEALKG